ncbi:MAG: hypothetical protein ACXVLT_02275 [Flavisolibacter sp.]
MKTTFLIIFSLLCLTAFSQTSQPVVEEKSSAWIKVVDDPVPLTRTAPARKKTATLKRKTTLKKTSVPKPDAGEEFEKTNSQVNRFKKPQKG